MSPQFRTNLFINALTILQYVNPRKNFWLSARGSHTPRRSRSFTWAWLPTSSTPSTARPASRTARSSPGKPQSQSRSCNTRNNSKSKNISSHNKLTTTTATATVTAATTTACESTTSTTRSTWVRRRRGASRTRTPPRLPRAASTAAVLSARTDSGGAQCCAL